MRTLFSILQRRAFGVWAAGLTAALLAAGNGGAQTPPAGGGSAATTVPTVAPPPGADGQRVLGNAGSTIVVAEYGDLRCPDSARAAREFYPRIEREFFPRIRYEFRDYPLPVHRQAVEAAAAARCVGEQGKYLEFRTRLLSDLDPLTTGRLTSLAREVGADPEAMLDCLAEGRAEPAVRQEKEAAAQIGVRATPTYVISERQANGSAKVLRVVSNPENYAEIRQAIADALADGERNTAAETAETTAPR